MQSTSPQQPAIIQALITEFDKSLKWDSKSPTQMPVLLCHNSYGESPELSEVITELLDSREIPCASVDLGKCRSIERVLEEIKESLGKKSSNSLTTYLNFAEDLAAAFLPAGDVAKQGSQWIRPKPHVVSANAIRNAMRDERDRICIIFSNYRGLQDWPKVEEQKLREFCDNCPALMIVFDNDPLTLPLTFPEDDFTYLPGANHGGLEDAKARQNERRKQQDLKGLCDHFIEEFLSGQEWDSVSYKNREIEASMFSFLGVGKAEEVCKEAAEHKKHVMIIYGATGNGKSTVLRHLALQIKERTETKLSSVICLPFKASALEPNFDPQDDTIKAEVERLLRGKRRQFAVSNADGTRQADEEQSEKLENIARLPLTLLIMIDTIDQHPRSVHVLKAILKSVNAFNGFKNIRLLITCTTTGLERASVNPDSNSSVEWQELDSFTLAEAQDVYNNYRSKYNLSIPIFTDLSRVTRRILTRPILLHLALGTHELLQPEKQLMPEQILKTYITENIEQEDVETFNKLVDLMLTKKRESGSIEAGSWLKDLDRYFKEPQILTCNRADEPISIKFTYEYVFHYLLLARAKVRFDLKVPSGWYEMAKCAGEFSHLRNAISEFLSKDESHALIQAVIAAGRSDDFTSDLIAELLADAIGEALPRDLKKPTVLDEKSEETVSQLLAWHAEKGANLIFCSIQLLFHDGYWAAARALLNRVLEDNNALNTRRRFWASNCLVVINKNIDEWVEAGKESRKNQSRIKGNKNRSLLEANTDLSPILLCSHFLNRASVFYDRGNRAAARQLCEAVKKTTPNATQGDALKIKCAAANNLGVFYVYFDEPDKAEEVLNEGLDALGREWRSDEDKAKNILRGHLWLNLALVLLFKAQQQYNDFTSEVKGLKAEPCAKYLQDALKLFEKSDYEQGMIYAHASLGLLRMCQGHWQEALKEMRDAKQAADELPEEWPSYGTQANLALWYRDPKNLHRNLDQALKNAEEAYERAKDNDDPEGIALSAMILARVLMDREASDDSNRAAHLLTSAYENLTKLKFHSAAARACAGLIEVTKGNEKMEWTEQRNAYREEMMNLNCEVYGENFANSFYPVDWKFLFLREIMTEPGD